MRGPRWAATALIAVVITVFTSGPVTAGDEDWKRIPCFSGAIEEVEVTDGDFLVLRGRVHCANRGPADATFGFARYQGDGPAQMFWVHMAPYEKVAPTKFAIHNLVAPGARRVAICVVTGYRVRVACVTVTRETAGSALTVAPLRTSAPLVRRKIQIVAPTVEGWPSCGTCW